MNKPNIKFSHVYRKLRDTDGRVIQNAKLLLVIPVSMEMISQAKDFLEYDTTHESGKYALGFQSYYLLLTFQKPFGDLFTTVRPMYGAYDRRSKSQQQTISKQKYYEGLIGQEFDIIITSARETAPREREPDFNGYSAKEEQERMHWIQQNLK